MAGRGNILTQRRDAPAAKRSGCLSAKREPRRGLKGPRGAEAAEMVRLGDVCEVLDSKRKPITKRDRIKGDVPYYGATGILDYVSGYIFDER